ncbi:MAG: SpoIIE family protein phosphatase [Oscillospiraceae bacterium]|nr:SpoIIE family protein phosphatase [Oscillospiraceae bacterium]
MKRIRDRIPQELVTVPLCSIIAAAGGFVLSSGTVSGTASTLAAAVAGICHPLYAMALLLGGLAAYAANDAAPGMQFLIACLAAVACVRVVFREAQRPHVLAFLTAGACILAGTVLDLVVFARGGRLPLYLLESVLTGIATYFLADGAQTLAAQRRISLDPGRRFTYAICYLLSITALCGVEVWVLDIGRIVGIAVTLLCARQRREHGGTLCGALTVCGTALCSVRLGTPLLFLPVTAMLAGFLSKLPTALWLPLFYAMQALTGAVIDGSRDYPTVLLELAVACGLYGLLAQVPLYRFVAQEEPRAVGQGVTVQQEMFLADAIGELREEVYAVMQRLTVPCPADPVESVKQHVCKDCMDRALCWEQRTEATTRAFRQLAHDPGKSLAAPSLDFCLRRARVITEMDSTRSRSMLGQMQRVHLLQERAETDAYLRLLACMATDSAKRRSRGCCEPETAALREILRRLACEAQGCCVYRLRSGRYAAEIYTRQDGIPVPQLTALLSDALGTTLESASVRHQDIVRWCFWQTPPYRLAHSILSIHAPAYERCGDHADAFCDARGDCYLVLSDGMGSGSTASLASRVAVRTLRRMILCDMPPETAIRLVNTLLMAETNTENFATLDVLCMSADTGEMTLWKSGAAATLLAHGGTLRRIGSESFPVGILPDALPARRRLTAYDGDTVLLLSDGISEAEFPYIRSLCTQGLTPEALAKAICDKAAVFCGGEARDDMTVIAARMTSRDRAGSTRSDNTSSIEDRQYAVTSHTIL